MAEKETKNNPKDMIEATPEEVIELIKDIQTGEELKEVSIKPDMGIVSEQKESLNSWTPKTQLGRDVKTKKVKDLDEVLEKRKKILEAEIVDSLVNLESDLLLIGQAKGKFGGGKRRAWRQTQKKTMEGNVISFSTMAVVGDREGHVGIGFGKAKETLPARDKAMRNAKLNIMKVKRGFENPFEDKGEPHTIPFKVNGKCGGVRITLIPAPRGTGLVVAGECRKILKLAGIKDIYSKSMGGTRTTFNLAGACVDALSKTTKMVMK